VGIRALIDQIHAIGREPVNRDAVRYGRVVGATVVEILPMFMTPPELSTTSIWPGCALSALRPPITVTV
jgi:hypothetical protein